MPTTFTFPSPIYLPRGEYAFVIVTATSEYNQWICQVGEPDISTADNTEPGTGYSNKTTFTWISVQRSDRWNMDSISVRRHEVCCKKGKVCNMILTLLECTTHS